MANLYKTFIEQKHPELLDEYKEYEADCNAKEEAKKQAERAQAKQTNHWYQFGFTYEVEHSYKGYTDGTSEYTLSFSDALELMTENEIGDTVSMCEANSDGMSFDEMAAECLGADTAENEAEFKSFLKGMLFSDGPYYIRDYLENKYDWESRVPDPYVPWDGQTIWDQTDFETIWAEFKTFKFKINEGSDD